MSHVFGLNSRNANWRQDQLNSAHFCNFPHNVRFHFARATVDGKVKKKQINFGSVKRTCLRSETDS